VVALGLGLAVGAALLAERGALGRGLLERKQVKEALAFLMEPYQELFLAGLPGDEAVEYVVFLDGEAEPADVARFFAAQDAVRFDREGSLPGTVVVTLAEGGVGGLERLRAQPFVRLTVRNQGLFFCH
jgi:hypothetical protein